MKLRTLGSVFATAFASACAELPEGTPGVGVAPEYGEVEAAATTLPDLTASISGPTSVGAGVPASFSVTASNIGMTKAFSPRIDVILPTGYTPTALSGCTWTLSTRTIRCAFTTMNAGNTRTASYTVSTPATAGTLVQTARA